MWVIGSGWNAELFLFSVFFFSHTTWTKQTVQQNQRLWLSDCTSSAWMSRFCSQDVCSLPDRTEWSRRAKKAWNVGIVIVTLETFILYLTTQESTNEARLFPTKHIRKNFWQRLAKVLNFSTWQPQTLMFFTKFLWNRLTQSRA